MKALVLIILMYFIHFHLHGKILKVGLGQSYSSCAEAAQDAIPGDSILFIAGVYAGGQYIENLQGTIDNPITIFAENNSAVIKGGTNAWQFSDATYIIIEGFTFEHQNGNGLNIDDGGSYESPSIGILIKNCIFRDIIASGNNDLLKMSGVHNFTIQDCLFLNGSDGGSGLDMVGCHVGKIFQNRFENQGSNAIQAKGGTQYINIEQNLFKNCGQRSLNIGGSTGLEYFRPINAPFEAANITVYSNIFIGSIAPIAFVGCVHSEVVNNTFLFPEKWVFRILQESVDKNRFMPCGNNTFINNIIYKSNDVSIDCNIGPNTSPETFILSNNCWFNYQNVKNSQPNGLPVADFESIVDEDPLFQDIINEKFMPSALSPVVGKGKQVLQPKYDFLNLKFNNPRSIGAIEAVKLIQNSTINVNDIEVKVFPNPSFDAISLEWESNDVLIANLEIMNHFGQICIKKSILNHYIINLANFDAGIYLLKIKFKNSKGLIIKKITKL